MTNHSGEMVEKVARAIVDAQGQWEWENNRLGTQQPWQMPHVELLARAALLAARDLPEGIALQISHKQAQAHYEMSPREVTFLWEEVIDAALQDPK